MPLIAAAARAAEQSAMPSIAAQLSSRRWPDNPSIFLFLKRRAILDTTCFLFEHHGPKCLEAAAAIKPQQQVEGIARMQASRN